MSVLHAFCHHLNSILIRFYWLLLPNVVLKFPALLSRVVRKPVMWILSHWTLPHDAGSGCGESRNRLLTVLYIFFFCLLVLYFYVAPSRVFFEYVSWWLFRSYLLILIGYFTCILDFFNLTSFYIYYFYSTFNCSFVLLELFR